MKSSRTRSNQSTELTEELAEAFALARKTWPEFNDQPAEVRGRLLASALLAIEVVDGTIGEFEEWDEQDTCPNCKHQQMGSEGEYCLKCGYNLMEGYMP